LAPKNDSLVFCLGRLGTTDCFPNCFAANFVTAMPKSVAPEATMKCRMSKCPRFWVDVEYDDIKSQEPGRPKSEFFAQILRAYEEAGDAMRFLNASGRVAWRATPRMLTRLADAEREARDDLADWP
jgi:hypothetical protein